MTTTETIPAGDLRTTAPHFPQPLPTDPLHYYQPRKHRYANQKYAETILAVNQAAPSTYYQRVNFPPAAYNVLQCSLNPNYPKTLFYFLCYMGGLNGSAAAAYLGGNIRFLDQDGADAITSQWITNNPAAINAFGKSIACIAGAEANDETNDSLPLTVGTPIPDTTNPEPGFFILKPRLLTGSFYGAAIDVTFGSPPTVAVPYVHLFMGFWQYFD